MQNLQRCYKALYCATVVTQFFNIKWCLYRLFYFKYEILLNDKQAAINMKPYIFRLFKGFNSDTVSVKSVRSLKMFDFYP